MYKCTDCGLEFEIKPDYCDCGNDIFTEIIPQNITTETKEIKENKITNISTQENNYIKTPQKQTTKKKIDINITSVIIFILCIILSCLSIIYIGKDSADNKEEKTDNKKITTIQPTNNMPSINSLWKENTQKVQTNQPQPQIQKTVFQPENTVKETIKPTYKKESVQPKITQQPQSKTTIKKTNPIKNNVSTTQNTKQIPPKTTSTTQPKKVTQKPVTSSAQPIQKQTTPVVTNKQELANYKIGLRKYLDNSIDFAKIIGDGTCSVSFKIDTAGNLINRKFASESDNDSLNNAVYHAIMNNPTYKSPPASYHNETMTLTVKMYGGRFTVTLY